MIDCWACNLDAKADAASKSVLSPEELKRAEGFAFEVDRKRYTACHSWMRSILGGCLDIPAAAVRFGRGVAGKPEIVGPNVRLLHFSLSHSGPIAALAVSFVTEIGIDVEKIAPVEPDIAASAFAAEEIDALAKLDEAGFATGFYTCWTRREAFMKAIGLGFSYPADAFAVSLENDGRLLRCTAEAGDPGSWRFLDFAPAPGYAGSLAVACGDRPVRLMHRETTDGATGRR